MRCSSSKPDWLTQTNASSATTNRPLRPETLSIPCGGSKLQGVESGEEGCEGDMHSVEGANGGISDTIPKPTPPIFIRDTPMRFLRSKGVVDG